VAPTDDTPKYGGVLRLAWARDLTAIRDPIVYTSARELATNCEVLWAGDWTRGAAGGYGTNEASWKGRFDVWSLKTGYLAESWELPTKVEGDTATLIINIRKGIHYGLNPGSEASRLVGGREMTADDVVFSLNEAITYPKADLYLKQSDLRAAKITSPAPWTVKAEFPWESFETAVQRFMGYVHILPPEVYEEYGDGAMGDWRNQVGTGPFMLTDLVPGSSLSYIKNPNYWMKDPVGPGKGNQLPYLDSVKHLIIPDRSTMYAAMRTGKVDWIGGDDIEIYLEDVNSFKKTTPQLVMYPQAITRSAEGLALRLDKEPFNDVRIRRALMMATDFETIKNDLYSGEAQIVTYPVPYVKEYADAYYGPDPKTGVWPSDSPESVKELYSYNPEKAKALLAEAGYPDGFKTEIATLNRPYLIDYYSVIANMWSKIGVDVELRPVEKGAFDKLRADRTFEGMLTGMYPKVAGVYRLAYLHGPGNTNTSGVDDPVVKEAYNKIQMAVVEDIGEANRLHREVMKHALDQVYSIPRVQAYFYSVTWPWLKNYSGEMCLAGSSGGTAFYQWVWIDQELKKSMGY
ncbi:ABC transporter substrate-binding protein, partial [Chloroflexota bacterium]